MKSWFFAVLVAGVLSLWPHGHAVAQGCGNQNPNCVVPTRPAGDSTKAAASTEFVEQNPIINIEAYGGKGDNSTDNTTPLSNALAALSGTGDCIRFRGGKYKFNSGVSFNLPAGIFAACIIGGGQDATILTWPNASGGITFNYAGASSSVHVRDLSLTTGTTTGGNALNLQNATSNANPAVTAISDIYRVTCRGDDGYALTDYWTNCVNVGNVSNIQFENLTVQGPSSPNGTGIALIGLPGSSTFGVVYNIAKSTFNNNFIGVQYGSFIQGVTVDQSNFTGFSGAGISVPGSQTGTLDQLAITNSQFNGAAGTLADISLSTATNHVQISNSLFFLKANHQAINIFSPAGFTLTGNYVTSTSTTGTTGYVIGGSGTSAGVGTIIGGGITGAGTGILIQTGVANTITSGVELLSNTTPFTNNSAAATNFIINNPGYNPVGTSASTSMGGSPFTVTAGASPETHYVLTAGTISSVTKGTRTLATAGSATVPLVIELGPFESYVTTWATTAPTFVRDIH